MPQDRAETYTIHYTAGELIKIQKKNNAPIYQFRFKASTDLVKMGFDAQKAFFNPCYSSVISSTEVWFNFSVYENGQITVVF